MLIASSVQMKMSRKIIDCESLEISQQNFCDKLSFSLVILYSIQTAIYYKENSPQIVFGICI